MNLLPAILPPARSDIYVRISSSQVGRRRRSVSFRSDADLNPSSFAYSGGGWPHFVSKCCIFISSSSPLSEGVVPLPPPVSLLRSTDDNLFGGKGGEVGGAARNYVSLPFVLVYGPTQLSF